MAEIQAAPTDSIDINSDTPQRRSFLQKIARLVGSYHRLMLVEQHNTTSWADETAMLANPDWQTLIPDGSERLVAFDDVAGQGCVYQLSRNASTVTALVIVPDVGTNAPNLVVEVCTAPPTEIQWSTTTGKFETVALDGTELDVLSHQRALHLTCEDLGAEGVSQGDRLTQEQADRVARTVMGKGAYFDTRLAHVLPLLNDGSNAENPWTINNSSAAADPLSDASSAHSQLCIPVERVVAGGTIMVRRKASTGSGRPRTEVWVQDNSDGSLTTQIRPVIGAVDQNITDAFRTTFWQVPEGLTGDLAICFLRQSVHDIFYSPLDMAALLALSQFGFKQSMRLLEGFGYGEAYWLDPSDVLNALRAGSGMLITEDPGNAGTFNTYSYSLDDSRTGFFCNPGTDDPSDTPAANRWGNFHIPPGTFDQGDLVTFHAMQRGTGVRAALHMGHTDLTLVNRLTPVAGLADATGGNRHSITYAIEDPSLEYIFSVGNIYFLDMEVEKFSAPKAPVTGPPRLTLSVVGQSIVFPSYIRSGQHLQVTLTDTVTNFGSLGSDPTAFDNVLLFVTNSSSNNRLRPNNWKANWTEWFNTTTPSTAVFRLTAWGSQIREHSAEFLGD